VLWAEERGVAEGEAPFRTFTPELLSLADWLRACGVTHVAMNRPCVYGSRDVDILEGQFEIVLVDAQHIKAVPGRKTDQERTASGSPIFYSTACMRGSFVPP